jgi:hypothetical protein
MQKEEKQERRDALRENWFLTMSRGQRRRIVRR